MEELLVNVIGQRIELAHVGAVDDVEVSVFAGADGELPHLSGGVRLADQKGAAGAEVSVMKTFQHTVAHLEIVANCESAGGGEPDKGIAIIAIDGETGGIQ